MTAAKKGNKSKESGDLVEKAYNGISQMLYFNEILPGQKIKYKDLADRLGVSMTPVIQALKWFELKGIVRHEPNRGYYINEVSLQEITEIYDTRILLEGSLTEAMVKHCTDGDLKQIQHCMEAYKIAVKDEDYYERLMTDMRFHLTLASISGCEIQIKILRELFDLILLKYSKNLILLGIMDSSQQEHINILIALQNRDVAGMANEVTTHLRNVKQQIVSNFAILTATPKREFADWHRP